MSHHVPASVPVAQSELGLFLICSPIMAYMASISMVCIQSLGATPSVRVVRARCLLLQLLVLVSVSWQLQHSSHVLLVQRLQRGNMLLWPYVLSWLSAATW
jgi:hypothetical protein